MNNRSITRLLLAGVLAGLAALSLAATCPHTAATTEREGHWDCRTCTSNPQQEWTAANEGGECQGHKHDSIMAWCKCSPNTKCESTDATYTGERWQETDVGWCGGGWCGELEYKRTANGTLGGKQTTGCGT